MPGRMDSEMQAVLERLRTSSITMADIRRCRRIHLQDKICTNSIAKELGLSVDIVEAACWAPPAAASAYNTFVAEAREHLSGAWGDVLKEAGSMWKQLDANQRARFESRAAGSNQAARVRLEQWESALEGLEVSKADAPVDVGPSREERKAQIKAEQQLQDASRIEREQQAKKRAVVRAAANPQDQPTITPLQQHNRAVKAAKEAGAANRAAFFQRHSAVLKEFGARVPAMPAGQAITAKQLDRVVPPPLVKATMRDYQLEGLRFLCQAHEVWHNLGTTRALSHHFSINVLISSIAAHWYAYWVSLLVMHTSAMSNHEMIAMFCL